jgi:hypothetical protein
MQASLLRDRHRCEESKYFVNKSALKLLLEHAGLYPDTEEIVTVIKV